MLARTAFLTLAFSGFLPVSGQPIVPEADQQTPASLLTGLPAGYTRSPVHWKGVLEAGKPEVYLTGPSFDHIEAQAKAINPSYTIFAKNRQAQAEAGNSSNTRALNPRYLKDIQCYEPGWSKAPKWDAVWDGIRYLQNLAGSCRMDAAGNTPTCSRVSCSWSSAIYFCNQKKEENWQLCKAIGDRAADAANHCHYWDGEYKEILTQGEAWDSDLWSAVVGYDDC